MYKLKKNNAVAALLLIFASCATSPKGYIISLNQQGEFAPLAPGALVYLYVDVPQVRSLLDTISLPGMKGMDKKQLAQVYDRTTSIVAAYYSETGSRRFLAVAQGTYPSFKTNTSFTFSPAWKKRRSQTGDSYWYSTKEGLSVSMGPERAFVSDGDPFVPSPGTIPPKDFASFRQGSVLAGWFEDATMSINEFLGVMGIPIQIPGGQILFGVQKAEKQYEADIWLETPSASQAKALAAILSMARLFMSPSKPAANDSLDPMTVIGTLFANPPVQDGPYLSLHTGAFTEKGIALLFNMFSIYSTNKN